MKLAKDIYERVKILAIDPGLNTCGVATMIVDFSTGEVKKVEAFTIDNSNYPPQNMEGVVDRIAYRKSRLEEILTDHVSFNHDLNIGVYESPFFNRLAPSAYGSLSEAISTIRMVLFRFNSHIPLIGMKPTYIKKMVGVKNFRDKDSTKEAVLKQLPDFKDIIEKLDEHSVDAVSIALAYAIDTGYVNLKG